MTSRFFGGATAGGGAGLIRAASSGGAMRGVSTGAGTRKLSAGALSAARRIGWAATAFGATSAGGVRFQRAADEMGVIAARISTAAGTDPVTSGVADSVPSNVAGFGAPLKVGGS